MKSCSCIMKAESYGDSFSITGVDVIDNNKFIYTSDMTDLNTDSIEELFGLIKGKVFNIDSELFIKSWTIIDGYDSKTDKFSIIALWEEDAKGSITKIYNRE